tara:strand:+ start:10505 stop:12085 length:1581 start_codon:yes stop_codon:yes gene_type:complete
MLKNLIIFLVLAGVATAVGVFLFPEEAGEWVEDLRSRVNRTAAHLPETESSFELEETPSSSSPALTDMPMFPSDQFNNLMFTPVQSSGGQNELESIIQDIRSANFEALSRYNENSSLRLLSNPVGLLKVNLNTGQYTTCTASVIDSNKILTNWHCLPKFGSKATQAILQMGFYRADDAEGVRRYSVDLTAIETSEELDYAVLKVDGDLTYWGTVRLSDIVPPEDWDLTIIHHPEGFPKQITQRGCRTGHPVLVEGRLAHKCDTMGGSSGAPVFYGEGADQMMIALHQAGVPQSAEFDPTMEFNRAVPMKLILANSELLTELFDGSKNSNYSTPLPLEDKDASYEAISKAVPEQKVVTPWSAELVEEDEICVFGIDAAEKLENDPFSVVGTAISIMPNDEREGWQADRYEFSGTAPEGFSCAVFLRGMHQRHQLDKTAIPRAIFSNSVFCELASQYSYDDIKTRILNCKNSNRSMQSTESGAKFNSFSMHLLHDTDGHEVILEVTDWVDNSDPISFKINSENNFNAQ